MLSQKNEQVAKSVFIRCACKSHILEIHNDPEDSLYELCFWDRKYRQPWSLWTQLRCIWRIICHGEPFRDLFLMDEEVLDELIGELVKLQLR